MTATVGSLGSIHRRLYYATCSCGHRTRASALLSTALRAMDWHNLTHEKAV